MKPNDLANLMTVGAAALGSLLLIIFKSRCTKIDCSFLWGFLKYGCIRDVNNDSDEEEDKDKKNEKKPVLPNKTDLLNKQLNDKILKDEELKKIAMMKEKPADNIIQE
jgi:hypothetical protein